MMRYVMYFKVVERHIHEIKSNTFNRSFLKHHNDQITQKFTSLREYCSATVSWGGGTTTDDGTTNVLLNNFFLLPSSRYLS